MINGLCTQIWCSSSPKEAQPSYQRSCKNDRLYIRFDEIGLRSLFLTQDVYQCISQLKCRSVSKHYHYWPKLSRIVSATNKFYSPERSNRIVIYIFEHTRLQWSNMRRLFKRETWEPTMQWPLHSIASWAARTTASGAASIDRNDLKSGLASHELPLIIQQTCRGSFSAVSKPMFAR